MRRAFILPAVALCLFIGCTSSNGNSKQVRDLQATVAALQRQATQTPTPTASPATQSPTPQPATSSPTPAPALQVSAAPIGNGCPVEFPIKVTAQKLAYNVDHPGYGDAVPTICYANMDAAARAEYAAAPPPLTVVVIFPVGTLVQVSTPGDCLVLRSAPSSTATKVDCRRDGENLRVTGAAVNADGHDWLPVSAVASASSGWASAMFVRAGSVADAPAAPPNAPSAQMQAVYAFYQAANAHNYTLAYALLGPTIKVGNPYERFVTGYQTTLSFQVTATGTTDPNTVHVDITTVDRVPTDGTVTRQFAGAWHLIPAQNSAGWLLDNAAISQIGGSILAPANAPVGQAPPQPSSHLLQYRSSGDGDTPNFTATSGAWNVCFQLSGRDPTGGSDLTANFFAYPIGATPGGFVASGDFTASGCKIFNITGPGNYYLHIIGTPWTNWIVTVDAR